MDEENNLKYAVHLIKEGKKQEAVKELITLTKSNNNDVKLPAIECLLSILDQIKDYSLLSSLCDDAISTSYTMKRLDHLAYFQMWKADVLSFKIGGWIYARSIYRLSPDWLNFSTEEDERKYNELDVKIKESEKMVDHLCQESINNANLANNKKLLGVIYLRRGPIWQNRFMSLKMEKIKRPMNFLPESGLKDLLMYDRSDLKEMDVYLSKSVSDLSSAIKIFSEIGDKDSLSYCLNNLTNYYLQSHRLFLAIITFKKLEANIKGTKDKELIRHFQKLKDRLKYGNKNAPNFVEEYKDHMPI